jgi:hypothetical protein
VGLGNDESPSKPFIIVNEQKQKCFEFDPDTSAGVSQSHNVKPPAELKSEKPENKQSNIPHEVNLDIKRAMETNTTRQAEESNEIHLESKVTKIADVALKSQPPIVDNETKARAQEKIQKLRELSYKVKTPSGLAEIERVPAYIRNNVILSDTPHSSESEISRFTLGTDENAPDQEGKKPALRPDNSFLHDKPD